MVFCHFILEERMSYKNILKCVLIRPGTHSHSPSVHLRWAEAQRQCFWVLLIYGFSLHGRVTDNVYLKCLRARVVISFIQSCCFLMWYFRRDQRSWTFDIGFCASLPAEISLDYLNLLIIWIVDGEIPKQWNGLLRNVFFPLKSWTVFAHSGLWRTSQLSRFVVPVATIFKCIVRI